MLCLAIDTATPLGSAAVLRDSELLSEVSARGLEAHSALALPLAEEALRRAGLGLEALDALAVGTGPGSFTGVRIGVATAKGLSLARALPLYGVSSFEAMLEAAAGVRGPVLTALDARRDELYAALSVDDPAAPGGRRWAMGPRHAKPEQIAAAVRALVGEAAVFALSDLSPALKARLTSEGLTLSHGAPMLGSPMARFVGAVVTGRRGALDTGALEPTYVRASDAKLPGGRSLAP